MNSDDLLRKFIRAVDIALENNSWENDPHNAQLINLACIAEQHLSH